METFAKFLLAGNARKSLIILPLPLPLRMFWGRMRSGNLSGVQKPSRVMSIPFSQAAREAKTRPFQLTETHLCLRRGLLL
jgi:hypothetical protein